MLIAGFLLLVFGGAAAAVGAFLNSSTQILGMILIIGGIGLAMAGLALLILGVIKKTAASRQEAQTPFTPAPPPGAVPAGPVSRPMQSRPAPAAGDSPFRLQCVSGAFAGKRYVLARPVRIGRTPGQNDLVFPRETFGVSASHCVLTVEGRSVLLTDLGSTYGTFVGEGYRLKPNETVTLQIGDRFWLGSEKQLFVIAPKGGL